MLLPIRDENPISITPFVNYGIIAACAAVFLWQNGLNERAADLAVYAYGLIPGTLFGNVRVDPAVRQLPGWLTIYTSMFMHGGWLHIIGNMWFLWIFGDNIEAAVGHKRYLFFYLLCGTAAAAAQIFHDPGSEVPMIGASGAISGILGAYFMLQPRSNVKVLVLLIIFSRSSTCRRGSCSASGLSHNSSARPARPRTSPVSRSSRTLAGLSPARL